MGPLTTRRYRALSVRQRRQARRSSAEVTGPTAAAGCGSSSQRLCATKVRNHARAVCVARWYDPATGQFLSVDPLDGLTQAPFNYAIDNPVNVADPSGRGLECFLTFHYLGCPPAAKVFDEDLAKLKRQLCANSIYQTQREQTIAADTIADVGSFLDCVADDATDLGWGPAVAGCLANKLIGTPLLGQLSSDFSYGASFALDPIGTLFTELVGVFKFVQNTATDLALVLSNNAYEIQTLTGVIIIPKNL